MEEFEFLKSEFEIQINPQMLCLQLTETGETMVQLPLDVPLARSVVAAAELGCSAELLTIAAMLNAGPIFHEFGRSPERLQKARRRFASVHGDCVSLLLIYRGYR